MFNIFALMVVIWLSATCPFQCVFCYKTWLNLCLPIICSLLSLEIITLFYKDNSYYKILTMEMLVRPSDSSFRMTSIWNCHNGDFLLLQYQDFGNQKKNPFESYRSTCKMYFWVVVVKTHSGKKKIVSDYCLPSS